MSGTPRKKRADIAVQAEVTVVYPHQLFEQSPALSQHRPVILAEDPWFFRRCRFHAQKLVLHRAAMRSYRDFLMAEHYKVAYLETAALDSSSDLFVHLAREGVAEIHLCDPLEIGLIEAVEKACEMQGIRVVIYESPMFLCSRDYIRDFYKDDRRFYLTEFYIAQRKRLGVLLEEDEKPAGRRWTFDTLNREPLPKNFTIPQVWHPAPNAYVQEAISYVKEKFTDAYGNVDTFFWPVTFEDANRWLYDFLTNRLILFGRYEDAMHRDEPILFHSALSPLLNIGLLTPGQVVAATLDYAKVREVPLASLEGFIRQIIGWREFIRAVYLLAGKKELASNVLEQNRTLPPCFWDASTGIEPADTTIRRVLSTAYCHHIERLMVLGNIMLLAGFHPGRVYDWFSELFIDAYDWVMVPNVYGMSQFADGGMISSKPYISGSRYILNMSDYPKGPWCELWDALYWRFLFVHRDLFEHNPRMAPFITYITRMPEEKRKSLIEKAERYLDSIGACAGVPLPKKDERTAGSTR
jgi:deoxyribodipyrimidine photolyase-related protein